MHMKITKMLLRHIGDLRYFYWIVTWRWAIYV